MKNVENADLENSIDDLICPIADDYSLAILSATRGEGKTVRELSREFEIPIATCYRRVDKLLETPLLDMKEKKLTEDGRRATVFRTGVSFIEISFSLEEKSLNVNIEPDKK
ncbi:hypothetical protein AKJ37_07795 [candidate division MSBL1 archaeon SCGC-AAA259I09]|uniref:HTH iclR-type domain-containing protein n=1 Tax=candidate division MSBL1 archaeon SCGC-AAA259I09 TaxID=1698267 RepID=A0A133UJ41_9EURY|nr:hypothetical protein AKJ37_07795 [candidate division MSBL1 archaeon SCGC-AAA259I09]